MKNKEIFLQFIKFGIVGASNTLISYGVYMLVLQIFKVSGVYWNYDYLVATAISFIISVFWSFCWNRRFVFKTTEKINFWTLLLKTYVSYSLTGLFLSSLLNWIWVDFIGLSKIVAPIISLLIKVPINFVLNKFWAFKS